MLVVVKNLRKIRRTIIILSNSNHSQKVNHSLLSLLHKVLKINLSNNHLNKFQRLRSSNNLKTIKRWQRKQLIRPKKKLKKSKLK
jgi:hypothetical protein